MCVDLRLNAVNLLALSMKFDISDVSELPAAADRVLEYASGEKIIVFYGVMGAGKTTFIKALCDRLHVGDTVSSPTFSIVNEYESETGLVYHFDFYRLKNETEALDLGYEEYFYSGNYCMIEWPEKIPHLLPDHYVSVNLEVINECRICTLQKY